MMPTITRRILAGTTLATLFVFVYWGWALSTSLSKQNPEKFGELPSFNMTSAANQSLIRKENLLGKVWIAGFIFTRCGGPCPIITLNMSRLQRELPGEVQLVSFTVDPDWDKPEILARYARRINADLKRWFFLTGEKKELYNLLYEGFKLPILENPNSPAGFRVTHSTKLALVDKKGFVRGYYDGTDDSAMKILKRDVLKLLEDKL